MARQSLLASERNAAKTKAEGGVKTRREKRRHTIALAERKIVPHDIRSDYTEKTTFVKRLAPPGIGRRLTDVRTEATTI